MGANQVNYSHGIVLSFLTQCLNLMIDLEDVALLLFLVLAVFLIVENSVIYRFQ